MHRILGGNSPKPPLITFTNWEKSNIKIFKDIKEAFYWLRIDLADNPENRKLLLEIGEPPTPSMNNFYYKKCTIKHWQDNENSYVTITGPVMFSSRTHTVTISKDEFDQIEKGVPFQTALRSTPLSDREFLISGMAANDGIEEDQDNDYTENDDNQDAGGECTFPFNT